VCLFGFVFAWFVHCEEWGVEVSHYYCVRFHVCFYKCGCPWIWGIDVQNWEFNLVDVSFDKLCNVFPHHFWYLLAENMFCWILLAWLLQLVSWDHLLGNFSPAFYFEVVSVFVIEVCFLYAAKFGSCLNIQSLSSCFFFLFVCLLFIRELCPLMLRNIRDQWLLLPVIFVVRGWIMFVCFSSFCFVVRRLISSFFLGIVSLLVLKFSFCYPL
jgi:hypothetical protein